MDLLGMLADGREGGFREGPDSLVCSRRGCAREAMSLVAWNNPAVHDPTRRKTWSACQEHVAYLEQYLRSRGFWLDTTDLSAREEGSSNA